MSISPKCDKCGKELVEFGAILLSPPNEMGDAHKFHLCIACYETTIKDFKKAER